MDGGLIFNAPRVFSCGPRSHGDQLELKYKEGDASRAIRSRLSSSRDPLEFVRGQFARLVRLFALNLFAVGHNNPLHDLRLKDISEASMRVFALAGCDAHHGGPGSATKPAP
jgi:hypothetical protein